MHEITYAESAAPPRAACLGLPLRPYSLGHEILLLAAQNPFVTLNETGFNQLPPEQQRIALTRAADICSMTWAENHFQPSTWLERRRYRKVYSRWSEHIATAVWPLETAEFRNYLAAGHRLLPTMSSSVPEDAEAYEIANKGEKLEGGRAFGSPLCAQLTVFAIGTLHLSHEAAMDFPFGHLCNLYFAALESKGAMAVENHREAEERATLAAIRSEIKTEKAAARTAWAACTTDAERLTAIQRHPRLRDTGMFPEECALIEWAAAETPAQRTAALQANPYIAVALVDAACFAEKQGIPCLP